MCDRQEMAAGKKARRLQQVVCRRSEYETGESDLEELSEKRICRPRQLPLTCRKSVH